MSVPLLICILFVNKQELIGRSNDSTFQKTRFFQLFCSVFVDFERERERERERVGHVFGHVFDEHSHHSRLQRPFSPAWDERSADRIAERSGACAAADDSLLRGRLSAVRVRRPAEGDVPGEHQAEDIA